MLKSFTLLYVEDSDTIIELVKNILKDRVKELFIAHDGEEGLALFKEHRPDIILTDIHMPRMNGIEMAQEIKSIDKEQAILILTAFNEVELLHESINIGVEGYITKPVADLESLLTPIERCAKRLQAEIDQKNFEHLLNIQAKTAAMGEMIGNIAHQWRQPLHLISSISTMMSSIVSLDEELDKEELKLFAHEINKQTRYLSETIDDFRDFLKANETEIKVFNIKDTIEKIFGLVKASLTDNDVELMQSLEDVSIKGNENQLIQSMINICNNAKEAISNNESERYFFVNLSSDEKNAIITFKDNGGGIEDEVKDKIFDPYFTTKESSIGTGLGLYMTFNSITKVFHGSIDVENVEYEYNSKVFRGAQFTIKIPLVK